MLSGIYIIKGQNMHIYAIDTDEREKITWVLAIICIIVSLLIFLCVYPLLSNYNPLLSFFIPVPTVLSLFGFASYAFDRWVWKLLVPLGVVSVPNLNGTWEGEYEPQSTGEARVTPPTLLTIKQTWTKVIISFEIKEGRGKSFVAYIDTNSDIMPTISYQYLFEPYELIEPFQMHYGSGRLFYSKTGNGQIRLDGNFYNAPPRLTHGQLHYVKK